MNRRSKNALCTVSRSSRSTTRRKRPPASSILPISGSEHAAPLLFEILRTLEPGGVAPQRPTGLQLDTLPLCTLSHQLPGPYCPHVRPLPYLPGRSRPGTCTLHRRVPIDDETGGLLTADCKPRPFHWKQVVVHPAELVAW